MPGSVIGAGVGEQRFGWRAGGSDDQKTPQCAGYQPVFPETRPARMISGVEPGERSLGWLPLSVGDSPGRARLSAGDPATSVKPRSKGPRHERLLEPMQVVGLRNPFSTPGFASMGILPAGVNIDPETRVSHDQAMRGGASSAVGRQAGRQPRELAGFRRLRRRRLQSPLDYT